MGEANIGNTYPRRPLLRVGDTRRPRAAAASAVMTRRPPIPAVATDCEEYECDNVREAFGNNDGAFELQVFDDAGAAEAFQNLSDLHRAYCHDETQ